MKKSKFDVRRTIELGSYGKITATAGALNYISMVLMEAAHLYQKQGSDLLAKVREKQSKQIYDALAKTGFYDD